MISDQKHARGRYPLWTHIKRVARIAFALAKQNRRLLIPAVAIAVVSDIALFQVLYSLGVEPRVAQALSFLTHAAVYASIFGRTLSAPNGPTYTEPLARRILLFITLALMALFIRGGVLAFRMNFSHWSPRVAIFAAAMAATIVFLIGTIIVLSPSGNEARMKARRSRLLVIGLILYLFAMRGVFLPLFNLIPEEAYYWNYSQHPAWGYLDHPPMVAWFNLIGSAILGHTELSVRLPALAAWIVAAVLAYRLTREFYSRTAALYAVLLMSSLPFFFGFAIILTPDAPLTACWVWALLYLYRALIKDRPNAWYAVGIFVGLGMLSKYTISLLGPAGLIYMLVDPKAKHWLKRPQPYLAVLISLVIFSPVIWWNSQHQWVSFWFQSSRRIEEAFAFSPHLTLASVLFLLTPTGLLAAIIAMRRRADFSGSDHRISRWELSPQFLFGVIFALFPVSVFLAFSLTHQPKLNWTAPAWLAVLPTMAFMMTSACGRITDGLTRFTRRIWMPTILVTVILYGAALNYLSPGFPGVGYPESMRFIAGFDGLGVKVGQYVQDLAARTAKEPLVVGMDKYNVASEMAYYNTRSGPANTAGNHLFGAEALSYRFWMTPQQAAGRNVVLVGEDGIQISAQGLAKYFDSLGAIGEIPVSLNGVVIGQYAIRTAWNYRP